MKTSKLLVNDEANLEVPETFHKKLFGHMARLRATIWLFVILVIIAVGMNFFRTSTVEFSLQADVESFSFIAPKAISTSGLTVKTADILSASSMKIDEADVKFRAGSRVSLEGNELNKFTVYVRIPAGWKITVEASDKSHFSLTADPPPNSKDKQSAEIEIVSAGTTNIRYRQNEPGSETASIDLPSRSDVVLVADSLSLYVDADAIPLFKNARFLELNLTKTTPTVDQAGTEVMTTEGAIVSGKLWRDYFPQILELTPMDQLSAHSVQDGLLRKVGWKDGQINILARGEAGRLQDKLGRASHDLRPVWLDVFRQFGLFQIILGIFTFVGGLELTAFFRRRA
jgi:Fe-S cluster assembly iron-binding protein IscA